jgi:hypothetical protein
MNQCIGSCTDDSIELASLTEELAWYQQCRGANLTNLDQNDNPGGLLDSFGDMMDIDEPDVNPLDVEIPEDGLFFEEYKGAGWIYTTGGTFSDKFNCDAHANKCTENVFYPFASKDEWQLASFLISSNLSMASIDKFLLLPLVCLNCTTNG